MQIVQIMHAGKIIQIMQIMQTARLRGAKGRRTGLTVREPSAARLAAQRPQSAPSKKPPPLPHGGGGAGAWGRAGAVLDIDLWPELC